MSLQVWLPLNGDLHNQGISDIATQNMGGVSTNSAGKIGACMSFNGSSTGYLRMPAILTATDNFSICFWMKLNNNTGNHCLYSQRTEAYATGFTIFYMSDSGIRFDDGLSLAMGLTLNANQWYHVTCCRDNDIRPCLRTYAGYRDPSPLRHNTGHDAYICRGIPFISFKQNQIFTQNTFRRTEHTYKQR